MNKNIKKLKFTLIEITVAFGVLAILIMFLMQFLSTAQSSWNFAEKRAKAYADSRIVFDLIEKSLKTAQGDISVGSKITMTGVKPYGDKKYGSIEFKLDTGSDEGELKIDSDESLVEYVTEFFSMKISGTSTYMIRLNMFGCKADYDVWKDLSNTGNPSPKEKYFREHGFIFTKLINLQ